jgi:hypothetical protein
MEMYMITVAETGAFRDQVESLLSEDEKIDLITYLSLNPGAGVLVQGTGGIRKLRWPGLAEVIVEELEFYITFIVKRCLYTSWLPSVKTKEPTFL